MVINSAYDGKNKFIYTCTAGEKVCDVAERFGMFLYRLIDLNKLKGDISAGDELLIEREDGAPYRVKAGDTVESICLKFGINTDDFKTNHVCHNIYPGLVVYIK